MRTAAENGVASPVHVQHVVKLVEVRVLRHLPLGIRVRNVDPASLHLLIEPVLVVARGTLESGLARLESRLLDTVAVVGSGAAGGDQHVGTRCLPARVETDHASRVWRQIRHLGLSGSVIVTVTVHVVQEYEHMMAWHLTQCTTGKMIALLATLPE